MQGENNFPSPDEAPPSRFVIFETKRLLGRCHRKKTVGDRGLLYLGDILADRNILALIVIICPQM